MGVERAMPTKASDGKYLYNRVPVRIVAAACLDMTEGREYILLTGARHWSPAMTNMAEALGGLNGSYIGEQGFIDQWDRFWTRGDALKVVLTNNIQPFDKKRNGCEHELYSEGIY